jgi:hypothetical protein
MQYYEDKNNSLLLAALTIFILCDSQPRRPAETQQGDRRREHRNDHGDAQAVFGSHHGAPLAAASGHENWEGLAETTVSAI